MIGLWAYSNNKIIDRGDVEICKVHIDENISDPLTKPLAQQKHDHHTESLSSRTLRKEVVLKQLRVKRPRNEQKRHLPRSGHLPRFSAEAEKETR
ncbi:hypothetical protein V6N12_045908 [Hibiscus sabdariffa]|uniref:Uncharacterized protein n=1 Tax=Hibiscus sabdariffa TaxID=183260 RepID=A0ABR2G452_9ROSI